MSRLRTQWMVNLSEPWTDPARVRPLIASFPLGKALLPHIDSAHQGLLDVQGSAATADAEIAACTAHSVSLDRTFNGHARGIQGVLAGVVEIAPTPEFAAGCEQARAQLFPQGLVVTRWKYAEKSGEAAMVAARRTHAIDAVLAQIRLSDTFTLADAADRWVRAGRELGANEERKHDLERARDAADEAAIKGRDVQRARQRWMRVTRTLLDNIVLDAVPQDVAERIVGELQNALARAASGASDEAEGEAGEVTEGDTTTGANDKVPVVAPATPANDTAPARKVG